MLEVDTLVEVEVDCEVLLVEIEVLELVEDVLIEVEVLREVEEVEIEVEVLTLVLVELVLVDNEVEVEELVLEVEVVVVSPPPACGVPSSFGMKGERSCKKLMRDYLARPGANMEGLRLAPPLIVFCI